MLKKEYDVFVAYHGSYDSSGTAKIAEEFYNYLTEKGLKVFYFPKIKRDLYKANIIDVMQSKTFVVFINDNLSLLSDGAIDTSHHYELSTEIDAFYALTQFGNDVSVQDSKIIYCNPEPIKKGTESKIHSLFANRTHFFIEDKIDVTFQEVYVWLQGRLSNRNSNDNWQVILESNEIKKVFPKRSSMAQSINLPQLIASSKNIRCLGISNSEVTTKIDPSALRFSLEHGGKIEILFLDPDGQFTKIREKEEGHRPNRIRNITENNIWSALDFKETLPDTLKDNYTLYKYDILPRINVIILDEIAILQYYANNIYGLNNPCFIVEKQEYSPLYKFCVENFEFIKESSYLLEE